MEAAKDAGFGEKKIQRAAGRFRVVYRDHTIKRPNNTPLRKVEWSLPDDDSETDSDGEDTSLSRSSHSSSTVLTVPTEALGRVEMSLSSLVRGGEDGQDGQEEVRGSVLTDETGVLTEAADPMCTRCGNPLVWPDSQQRGTCSACWLHDEDGAT